jgi:hypothetical protein
MQVPTNTRVSYKRYKPAPLPNHLLNAFYVSLQYQTVLMRLLLRIDQRHRSEMEIVRVENMKPWLRNLTFTKISEMPQMNAITGRIVESSARVEEFAIRFVTRRILCCWSFVTSKLGRPVVM